MLKPDQERIKSLLSETITLLCRNGLNFKSEFSVEALIGITLDQSDVFLVSIKETVQSAETATVISASVTAWKDSAVNHLNAGSSEETKRLDAMRKDAIDFRTDKRNGASLRNSRNFMRRPGSPLTAWEDNGIVKEVPRRRSKIFETDSLMENNDAAASRVKRARIDLSPTLTREKTDSGRKERSLNPREIGDKQKVEDEEEENSTRDVSSPSSPRITSLNVKSEPPPEQRSRSPDNRKIPSVNHQPHVKQTLLPHDGESEELLEDNDVTYNEDNETDEVVFVKNEPSEYHVSSLSDINGTYDGWMRNTSEQWRENTGYQSGGWMERGDSSGGPSGSSGHRFKQQGYRSKFIDRVADAAGSSYEYDGMDMKLARSVSSSVVTDPSSNYSVAQPTLLRATGAPDLSVDELVIARSVLSMRGSFISLGCLKANRQLIRRVSREHLMAIINKMSTPTDPAYFIGLLFDFGISRVFYKCPPASVSDAALMFYGFSGARYEDCYLRQVIVDKNIRDPESWIQKLQERSPFVQQ